MRLRPYLTLLRGNPAFTRLFTAQLITFAGDWFATVALLRLALELTGSAAVAWPRPDRPRPDGAPWPGSDG